MKPLSPQQRDALAYLDFAGGPVAVYDLVGRGLTWHHAQIVCGSLARRGDAAVFVDGGGRLCAAITVVGRTSLERARSTIPEEAEA